MRQMELRQPALQDRVRDLVPRAIPALSFRCELHIVNLRIRDMRIRYDQTGPPYCTDPWRPFDPLTLTVISRIPAATLLTAHLD